MTVLHLISSFLMLPATLLRAFSEHVLLKWMHIPVEDTAYLQKNELCGHVEHKPVRTLGKSFLLCFLPGLLLLVIGAPMVLFGSVNIYWFGPFDLLTGKLSVLFPVDVLLLYLGLGCLCRLFPTYEDALYLYETYQDSKSLAAKILLCVPVCVIRAGAFLARFSVSLLLAIAIVVCLFLI